MGLQRSRSGGAAASPDSPRRWKPRGLGLPALLTMCGVSLILAAAIQSLVIISQRNDGLVFANNVEKLPFRQSFWFKYLPTIIFIFYNFGWAWIDQDARRTEPFYQLSKEGGASGADSLLLQYPVEFTGTVVVKSFKKRHWVVFLSSFSTALAIWAMTPLQAGIFVPGPMEGGYDMAVRVSTSLPDEQRQLSLLSPEFILSAYSLTFLDEEPPGFMTKEYALAPFKPALEIMPSNSTNITSSTKLYRADLACEPVPVPYDLKLLIGGNMTTINEDFVYDSQLTGCRFEHTGDGFNSLSSIVAYANHSGGLTETVFQNFGVGADQCGPVGNGAFMASFAKIQHTPEDVGKETYIACRPTLKSQQVKATVEWPTGKVLRVEMLEDAKEIPADEIRRDELFNIIWSPGDAYQDTSDPPFRRGVAFEIEGREKRNPQSVDPMASFLSMTSYLEEMFGDMEIQYDDKVLTHLALGGHYLNNYEKYLNIEELTRSYEGAMRLLFARAMRTLLDSSAFEATSEVPASIDIITQSLQANAPMAYVVEALLILNGIFAALLAWIVSRRKSNLVVDPSTIASVMSLCTQDKRMLDKMDGLDRHTWDDLSRDVATHQFQLSFSGTHDPTLTRALTDPAWNFSEKRGGYFDGVRPMELRSWALIMFYLVQTAALAVFAVFFGMAKGQGLIVPSMSTFSLQLLLSFLPVAFATLTESLWLVITRMLCVLKPYTEMSSGRSAAARGISLNYTSIPPQVVAFRALESLHITVALACSMAFFGNILAIMASDLFTLEITRVPVEMEFPRLFQDRYQSYYKYEGAGDRDFGNPLSNKGGFDYAHALANIDSNGTADLPAWIDEQYFYVPVDLSGTPSSTLPGADGALYELETRAFALDLQCKQLLSSRDTDTFAFIQGPNQSTEHLPVTDFSNTELDPDTVLFDFNEHAPSFNPYDPYDFNTPDTIYFPVHFTLRNGSQIQCNQIFLTVGNSTDNPTNPLCPPKGRSALEFGLLGASLRKINLNIETRNPCQTLVYGAWARYDGDGACNSTERHEFIDYDPNADQRNKRVATAIGCEWWASTRMARVTVNRNGIVQNSVLGEEEPSPDTFFDSMDDLELMNDHFQGSFEQFFNTFDRPHPWHTSDEVRGDILNYLISKTISNRLQDPSLPPPSFDESNDMIGKVYRRLSALWLLRYHDVDLAPLSGNSSLIVRAEPEVVKGIYWQEQRRIFMSPVPFYVTEVIIGLYAIAVLLILIRRPGLFLPCMPTSLAAVMASFSRSQAIEDFRGTSHLNWRQLRSHIAQSGYKYGYGEFVGEDGKMRLGIEKAPFVRPMRVKSRYWWSAAWARWMHGTVGRAGTWTTKNETWLSRKETWSSKKSGNGRRGAVGHPTCNVGAYDGT